MPASAAYHFDAQASLVKKNIAASGTTTATLDDTTGVSSVLWTVAAAYGSSTSDWSLSTTTGTSTVVTAPSGVAKSCLLQCKVNGGVQIDPVTGRQTAGGQTIRTAKIYIAPETIVTGETTESDATNGWSPIVNAAIVATGGTSALAGTSLSLSDSGDTLTLSRAGSDVWNVQGGASDTIRINGAGLELDATANILLDVGAGSQLRMFENESAVCDWVLDADGATSATFAQGCTGITFGQTQRTSGAGAAWTMRAQQGQAGQVGGDLTIGGGNGGTPGTNAGGDTRVKLCTPVGGASRRFFLEREDGTKILTAYETGSGASAVYFGDAGGTAQGTLRGTNMAISTASDYLAVDAGTDLYLGHAASGFRYRRLTGGATIGVDFGRSFGPIASATTTTVASFTTTSNRVYDVEARVVVSNDTDNEGATYRMAAGFKNVAGTVTQIGSTVDMHTPFEDAGQTGLSATIDFSGTAIRVRLTTDAADTINGTVDVSIVERVLA